MQDAGKNERNAVAFFYNRVLRLAQFFRSLSASRVLLSGEEGIRLVWQDWESAQPVLRLRFDSYRLSLGRAGRADVAVNTGKTGETGAE